MDLVQVGLYLSLCTHSTWRQVRKDSQVILVINSDGTNSLLRDWFSGRQTIKEGVFHKAPLRFQKGFKDSQRILEKTINRLLGKPSSVRSEGSSLKKPAFILGIARVLGDV